VSKDRIHIDDALISRYLAGAASMQERNLVEKWVSASEKNRAYLEGIEKIWRESATGRDRIVPDVDVNAAWNIIRARMDDHVGHNRFHFNRGLGAVNAWVYRVAAVLLVFAGVYLIYQSLRPNTDEIQLVASETVIRDSLPDGSTVMLNAGATLAYRDQLKGRERRVAMTGEAYFEVSPDPVRIFEVQVEGALIRVLGTAFNVKADKEDGIVEVAVKEGKVALWNKKGSDILVLESGETGRIDKRSGAMTKMESIAADVFYWNSKILIFKDTPLEQVIGILERIYGEEILVSNDLILHCKLSGRFRGENLQSLLQHIVLNFSLELKQENNRFIITGEGC
jgi:ferric-dicitrate binding protein FerR (iron transport regulator)